MTADWLAVILDESKWLTFSMGVAFLAAALMLYRFRRAELRDRVLGAMTLLFATTISAMAFGHLLAVTIKLIAGTLVGPVAVFYGIGIALAVPAWWLLLHALRVFGRLHSPTTLWLNGWLVVTLVVLGLPNIPLAAPGVLTMAYQVHTRPAVGWALAGMVIVLTGGLFIGSLIFLASGLTFEQFRGMQ
jgi:hypothetical protein